jgi:flagellar biosynthesis/type III secretory pathway M-ring protein FliF/YscJ
MLSGKKDNDTDNEAIEKVRQLASEMASKEPEAAARILRGWLADAKTEKELS